MPRNAIMIPYPPTEDKGEKEGSSLTLCPQIKPARFSCTQIERHVMPIRRLEIVMSGLKAVDGREIAVHGARYLVGMTLTL